MSGAPHLVAFGDAYILSDQVAAVHVDPALPEWTIVELKNGRAVSVPAKLRAVAIAVWGGQRMMVAKGDGSAEA